MANVSKARAERRRGQNRAKRARKHHAARRRRVDAAIARFRLEPDSEYLKMASKVMEQRLEHDFAWWRRVLRFLSRGRLASLGA